MNITVIDAWIRVVIAVVIMIDLPVCAKHFNPNKEKNKEKNENEQNNQ